MKTKEFAQYSGIAIGLMLAGTSAATVNERFELVSVSTAGVPADTGSYMSWPGVSADGRYVVFASQNSKLVTNDTNGVTDIFVRDRTLQTTTRVSVASDGSQANGSSDRPSISSNGRYIVYESNASNLVAGDTAKQTDVFMYDQQTRITTRISVKADGSEARASSGQARISSDGHYVVFQSGESLTSAFNGNTNCYMRDTVANTNTLISVAPSGAAGDGFCANPVISDDGTRVAFETSSGNLGTAHNGSWQIIMRDFTLNQSVLVSQDANGIPKTQGNDSSSRSVQFAMSADGRLYAYSTTSGSLDSTDTNGNQDVYVSFIPPGQISSITTVRASTNPANALGNADSPISQGERVSLSGNGYFLAYDSSASNIGTNGVSSAGNVMIESIANGQELTLNVPLSAYQAAKMPYLSPDDKGRYLVFASGSKLDARFASGGIYIYDRQPQTGYWWNPAEPGRGYNIEQSGNKIFMASFLYDASGRSTWYGIGPDAMDNFDGTSVLTSYANGQTLTGSYKAPAMVGTAGNVSVSFTSGSTGVLTWPGGTTPIVRYDFGPGGSAQVPAAGYPQPGWWWAPSEGGRGYAIEVQGGSMLLAGYMYDAQGNPVWFDSGPTPMLNAQTYQGTWQTYGNGQTLTGAYKPAAVTNPNAGNVSIQFSTPTTGTLTFPDGRQVAIARYSF